MPRPLRSSVAPKKCGDRYSFSLYASDLAIIADVMAALRKRSVPVDRTKLVRGLLHLTSERDLLTAAVQQHSADLLKTGPRETENIAERFTIEQLGADAGKIERVVASLRAKGIRMNDSYVLRSLLRRLLPDDVLAPLFKKYLVEFPDRRTRAARAKKHA